MGREFVHLDGFTLPLDAAGNPPAEFQIFAAGTTTTKKGEYVYDEEAASAIRSAEEDKRRKPWMDYEHQSLVNPPIEAPAAAFYDLEYRPDGLYAVNVKWRPRAAQYLRGGEYLFHSPAFWKDKDTGRVMELVNDALTNDPATHDARSLMPLKASLPALDLDDESDGRRLAVLAADKPLPEKHMSKAIMVALGVKDDEDESAGIAAATQLSELRREIIALTGKPTLSEAVGALHAYRASNEQIAQLSARAEAAEKKNLETEINQLIDSAARDGKIPPAKRAEFVALGQRDLVALKTTIDLLSALPGQAPPVVAAPQNATAILVALSAEEEEVARMLGNDLVKLREHKAKKLLNPSAQPTKE